MSDAATLPMRRRLKQTKLKLTDGGPREPLPPKQPKPHKPHKGTSRLEYPVLFAVAGIIWCTIVYWIWKWIFH
ncbi:MAG: hypothetical protein NTZ72_16860 [Afipia sp.]|nr:hypothetical protein [Afipia sp.]